MKKFLSLLLAAMILLSCMPATAEDALVWKINESLGTLKLDSSSNAAGHVEIPAEVDGVTVMALDYMCFKSTFDITSIAIPDTVRMFECSTLDGTANLAALTLPKDLIIIKNGSLTNMPLIETMIVPPSVSVVNGAFSSLPKMKSLTFEGVCPIFVEDSYYGLFADLPADCVIYVPDDQIDAYKAAFADREDVLGRIQPSGKNAVVIDWTAPESDFQFDAATGTITGYTGNASRIDIPATIGGVAVKHIGKQAFLQKYSLMYVTIPEGVETIEKQAFHGCSLMTYVSFPTTLHTLGDSAFNTNNLVDVGWSEGLVNIGSKAFYNCDICYATLPSTLRTIADSGFENAGFVEVTFGPNVETIGEKGFAAKTIEAITYTGSTMPTFGADAFKGCNKAATLTLAGECTSDLYNSFVTYMADAFPKCVVNEPAFASSAIEGFDHLLGDWYDDIGNKLSLTNDGTMTFTWAMDGWVDEYTWSVTDGAAVVTSGTWNGCPITLDNGILTITNGEGIFQIFSVDGDLSAYYGSGDGYESYEGYELPEAQPIGDEGAPYFGSWKLISMAGMNPADLDMEMILSLNQDGTCSIFDGYSSEPGVWAMVNGVPDVMGSSLTLDAEGNLVMTQDGADMVFARDGEAPSAPVAPAEPAKPAFPALDASAEPFIGKWNADTIAMNGEEYPASIMNMTASITLNADGTAQMIMFDRDMFDGDPTFWYVADGQVWVGMDLANGFMIQPLDDGRLGFDMDGMLTKYVKEGAAAPVGGTEAPAVPAAPSAGGSKINVNDPSTFVGKEFKCVELITSGVPMDLTYYPANLVVFHDNGMADVTISGSLQTNQPYIAGNMGGVDTIMVTYMNYTQLMYNVGETGLDLNYMGMMDMHFEAQ